MSYHGDIALGATIDIKFTTRQSTGAPFTLAGTPVISAYVGNGTTEITAGITLTTDFDARTGLNNVRVVATSGNGFATATDVDLVITTGTVNSVSVVGEVIGSFSIEHRAGLSPAATANLQTAFDDTAGPVPWLGIVDQGTAQAVSGTTVTLRAAAAFGDNTLGGCVIGVLGSTQGYWQFAGILSNVGATDVATLDSTWAVTPSGTITYKIFGGPLAPTVTPVVDVTKWLGTAVSTPTVAGVPNVNVKTWNDLTTVALPLVPTTAGRTLDVSATGEAGIDWANVGSPTTAVNLSATNIDVDQVVASVSGAVGSVTGLTASNLDVASSTLATAANLAVVAGYLDTEIAAIKAKTDSLTFTAAGKIDANLLAIGGSTTALTAFKSAVQGNVVGTVGAASTTTSIVTSAVTPATSVADQLKGRIVTFADDTTTAALRGQATDITASSASATPTLTVTALTTAPVSGDTFSVV